VVGFDVCTCVFVLGGEEAERSLSQIPGLGLGNSRLEIEVGKERDCL
jgi:hypothetical protein